VDSPHQYLRATPVFYSVRTPASAVALPRAALALSAGNNLAVAEAKKATSAAAPKITAQDHNTTHG